MQKIMVVDDDPTVRDIVVSALQNAGYQTYEAEGGQQALERFDPNNTRLVVLDIVMGDINGTDVCRTLRQKSAIPIVFLSAKDDEIDRILGLELGGDDYITKPFSPRELVARVRAVLRRNDLVAESMQQRHPPPNDPQPQAAASQNVLRHNRIKLDQDQFKAYWDQQEVILTVTEAGILRTLLQHPGRVYSRDQLMNSCYSYNNVVSDRTIDSHVRRVRAKFSAVGGDPIETVHGVGYKLSPCS